jgi:hypothetical protein
MLAHLARPQAADNENGRAAVRSWDCGMAEYTFADSRCELILQLRG